MLPVGLIISGAGLAGISVGQVAAAENDDPAARAAAEIQAARDRANAAAEAAVEAEVELENLEDEAVELEERRDELQAQVGELDEQVQIVAVNRFMAGGGSSLDILEGPATSTDRLVSAELVATATSSSERVMDDYAEKQLELAEAQEELENTQAEVERQRDEYEQAQENAEAEVVRLQEVEQKRL